MFTLVHIDIVHLIYVMREARFILYGFDCRCKATLHDVMGRWSRYTSERTLNRGIFQALKL